VILSSLIFAKQYSRAAVIKHQLTRKDFQSKMCRDPHTDWKLQQLGHAIVAIRLQGFIFFGTASKLQDRIAELIADREQWVAEDRLAAADEAAPSGSPARGKTTNPPEVELAHSVRYLLLDFESVSDVDSTGVFAFTKLRRMTKECGIETLFTTMSPRIEKKLLHKYKIVPLEAYIPTLHEVSDERCSWLMRLCCAY
jgi:SulP family sulfate permease